MTMQAVNNNKNFIEKASQNTTFNTSNKVLNFVKSFFKSPIVQFTFITAFLITFNALGFSTSHDLIMQNLPRLITLNAVALVSGIILGVKQKKVIEHEVSVYWRLLRAKSREKKGDLPFNKIIDNVYLGAMPLNNQKHFENILNLEPKNKKLSILSMQEKWELERPLPFASKVSKTQLIDNHITQLVIEGKDHKPIPLDDLEKGVRFLQNEIKAGKKVYIHCKAGRGRSATVLACYFMVEKGFSVKEACSYIENIRKVTLYKKQERLNEFYQKVVPKMRREKLNFFQRLFF